MTLERSSDKHGPVADDIMKEEMVDELRAGRSTRAEPLHDPESFEADDAPDENELIAERRAAEAGRTRPGHRPGG
jgi:hypothetical protein